MQNVWDILLKSSTKRFKTRDPPSKDICFQPSSSAEKQGVADFPPRSSSRLHQRKVAD
ncbi:hypothetical protein Pyn_04314 [Prunus yedoensis var. nudiflora]|uniref:Uncharacterized protein n=1 Tax=Prunus yedoensis var. nudiflora TaxID=2094558 RepID=A0A314U9U7_PRUYE|nr:hypothetical protein Pyn_04314 [Prunus yedoensis var. nudiflora]